MSDDKNKHEFEPFPVKQSTTVTIILIIIFSVGAGFVYRIVNYGFQ